ncbi:hypothetical protein NFC81_14705 [Salinispirillum sp. LH 10-3-1]|uniref:Uncharacterized protein n=1 Tax=Salinispirillum sp. LH 10-3-1 TaxID=2952525 RepID=A0AB38YGH0_9GAMM
MKWIKQRLLPHQQQFLLIVLVVSGLLLLGYSLGYAVGKRAQSPVAASAVVAPELDERQAGLREDMRRLTALIQAQVDGAELTQEAVALLRRELAELQQAYQRLEQAHEQQAEALRQAEAERQRLLSTE